MSLPRALLALCALGSLSCGAALRSYGARGCVPAHGEDVLELVANNTVSLPPTCTFWPGIYLSAPLQLTARQEGLEVHLSIADSEFVPGAWRLPRGPRDAVVLFPQGQGSSRPTLEVETDAISGGYSVEELIPWSTLSPDPAQGRFVLHLVLFNRERNGEEQELRLVFRIRLRGIDLGA